MLGSGGQWVGIPSGTAVSNLNGLTGGVTLSAGLNIVLTPVGNVITIDVATNLVLAGTTGASLELTSAAVAPTTTATPVFTSYYGANTKVLGDPNAWALIKVNGNDYKVPLYS